MLKNSCAGSLGLSLAILSQFTLEMCVSTQNTKKFTKTLNFWGLSSFKVINVNKTKNP